MDSTPPIKTSSNKDLSLEDNFTANPLKTNSQKRKKGAPGSDSIQKNPTAEMKNRISEMPIGVFEKPINKQWVTRLQIAGQIAKTIGSTLEPEELFREIVSEIRKAVPCERCVIATVDLPKQKYLIWHNETDTEALPLWNRFADYREWIIRELYESKQTKYLPDLGIEEMPWARSRALEGFQSAVFIPILQEGQCVAHLSILRTQRDAFTPECQILLKTISDYLGSAIRNASLFRLSKERAARLNSLQKFTQKISKNMSLPQVFKQVVYAAANLLNGDYARLYLYDEANHCLEVSASYNNIHDVSPIDSEIGEKLAWEVFRYGKLSRIGEASSNNYNAKPHDAYPAQSDCSIALQPLRHGAKTIGVVLCISRQPNHFGEMENQLLNLLTSQAGIAIQNARLLEEETRSRKFLERMVGDSADPIIATDTSRIFILWNKAAENLYGFTQEEMVGKNMDILVPESLRSEEMHIWENLHEQGTVTYETYRLRKDGTCVPVSITFSPVKNDTGKEIARTGIHRDLTERRQGEEALQEYAGRLQTLSHKLMEAQEAERRRIARELHDEIGQALTAVKINLQSMERPSVDSQQIGTIEDSVKIVDDVLLQLRDISLNLRPSILDDLGLVSALRWYVNRLAKRSNLEATFRSDPINDRFPADVEIGCFRVAQEALTNVVRHSKAGKVGVDLKIADNRLELFVYDDGTGFRKERFFHRQSAGLSGMQERVQLLGGQIEIDSCPGKGTEIRASFPLNYPLPGE